MEKDVVAERAPCLPSDRRVGDRRESNRAGRTDPVGDVGTGFGVVNAVERSESSEIVPAIESIPDILRLSNPARVLPRWRSTVATDGREY